jgi:hypothetical protein
MLVGSGTGNAAEALMFGAAVGATWTVPFLIGSWGEGSAMKHYDRGTTYLIGKDYDAAAAAYQAAIRSASNSVSEQYDPAQQDPRDQFGDGGW